MKTWKQVPTDVQNEIIERYPKEGPATLAAEYNITENSLARAVQRKGIRFITDVKITDLLESLRKGPVERTNENLREAEKLRLQGYEIEIGQQWIVLNKHARHLPNETTINEEYTRIGVISDTHFGSRYQQPTALASFMQEAKADVWLHIGDLVQGINMFRGWEGEAYLHTADLQREEALKLYPHTNSQTYIISGNHEQSFLKGSGYNIVQSFANERDDVTFLGNSGAFLTISGIRIYMWHPAGGSAYAKSFKIQKQIEAFAGGNKPDIIFAGHWHFYNSTLHRNVFGFNVPCWQTQTPYEMERSLYPDVGGLVIEVWRKNGSLHKIRHEYFPIWIPREEDY